MKKLFLYAALCLTLTQVKAQQGVVFKIKYQPNKNYQLDAKIGVKANVTLTGDQDLIDKLKSQGITQPVMADANIGYGGTMKTGTLAADNSFPIAINMKLNDVSLQANGNQVPIPPKATEKSFKAYGHVSSDNHFRVDSADGKRVNDSTEKKMQKMLDFVQNQIKFPEKPMKPGDSFTQSVPINVPVGGKENNLKIDASVTYKLIKIEDGKAYFDLTNNVNVNFQMKQINAAITGTGAGKMVYSIKDNYPVSKDATINLKIKLTSDKINADGKIDVTSSYTGSVN